MVPLKVKLWRSENASVMAKASFVVTEVDNWKFQGKFGTNLEPVPEDNLTIKKFYSFKLVRISRTKQLKMSNTCPKTLLMN
jgi:hypothetical protein